MNILWILIVIVVILAITGGGYGGFYGAPWTGFGYGGGAISLIVIGLIVLLLLGRL